MDTFQVNLTTLFAALPPDLLQPGTRVIYFQDGKPLHGTVKAVEIVDNQEFITIKPDNKSAEVHVSSTHVIREA
ncbi:hypothetical protein CERSUDRAFT_93871 [Gelatoporia subvermispora B]|uniref:Uncharacterized protein n=1 Tax=Ceriporiopsis subvermispora (strain B) TaxID=914234 RepID=M2R1E3_CERS8|nr:hypothetical protein CERSUDRAFT_93871 [Gelatoporia subvermispora B]